MSEFQKPNCPDCEELEAVDRRGFIRTVSGSTAGLVAAGAVAANVPHVLADVPAAAAKRTPKPAEALVRELYASLNDDQKKAAVYPWNHKGSGQTPTRLGMYNRAIFGQHTIGKTYNKQQQELVERILKSISSGEEGYSRISRNGTFDGSRALQNCGAYIFGDPSGDQQYSWVFSGHHLTVRCDGNSEPGAAFGGPMYYGHSANGYSKRNVFNYQTESVKEVFDALNEKQRKAAVLDGTPGERAPSVRFREDGFPGLGASALTADQKKLVERVMRDILSPYRKEDADEVMQIIRTNGGLEKIHLAFYKDRRANDNSRWHFWRLEGPGFVWNYRVLPHVHTYVNIATRMKG